MQTTDLRADKRTFPAAPSEPPIACLLGAQGQTNAEWWVESAFPLADAKALRKSVTTRARRRHSSAGSRSQSLCAMQLITQESYSRAACGC